MNHPTDEEYVQSCMIVRMIEREQIFTFKDIWMLHQNDISTLGELSSILSNMLAADLIRAVPGGFIPATGESSDQMFAMIRTIVNNWYKNKQLNNSHSLIIKGKKVPFYLNI